MVCIVLQNGAYRRRARGAIWPRIEHDLPFLHSMYNELRPASAAGHAVIPRFLARNKLPTPHGGQTFCGQGTVASLNIRLSAGAGSQRLPLLSGPLTTSPPVGSSAPRQGPKGGVEPWPTALASHAWPRRNMIRLAASTCLWPRQKGQSPEWLP